MQLAWLGFESNFVFTHQLPGISKPKTWVVVVSHIFGAFSSLFSLKKQ